MVVSGSFFSFLPMHANVQSTNVHRNVGWKTCGENNYAVDGTSDGVRRNNGVDIMFTKLMI